MRILSTRQVAVVSRSPVNENDRNKIMSNDGALTRKCAQLLINAPNLHTFNLNFNLSLGLASWLEQMINEGDKTQWFTFIIGAFLITTTMNKQLTTKSLL